MLIMSKTINQVIIADANRDVTWVSSCDGIILPRNQGKDQKQLSNPKEFSNEIDEAENDLQRANVTYGRTAISAEGKAIVWAIGSVSATMTISLVTSVQSQATRG